MAWKQCTSAMIEGAPLFINLDNVAKLTVHSQGTQVAFVGAENMVTVVKETPAQILLGQL